MAATVMTIALKNKQKLALGGGVDQEEVAAEEKAALEAAEAEAAKQAKQDNLYERYPVLKYIDQFIELINTTGFQTILYFTFVVVFQNLVSTMRKPEEYYVDKLVMDRIVENHFDSSHNTLESVRRIADIYEWGNTVLMPGLFADLGPCDGDNVGRYDQPKTCQDEVWPDGDGSFHGSRATPYSIADLVELTDRFDWTDGLLIRQVRQAPMDCPDTNQIGLCYPEYSFPGGGSQESFGWNYTHPGATLDHPFTYMSTADAGGNPGGFMTASFSSFYAGSGATYEAGGYLALVIPFFSTTYLPYEEGDAASVTDYRLTAVNTTNGKTAAFYCLRTSLNGYHIKQLCDPGSNGDGTGALTGAVRAGVERFWNDLKRSHYLDARTRVVSFVLQLRSNPLGIRYRINLMFEVTSPGAILPSFDVTTYILDSAAHSQMGYFVWIGFVMVVFFSILEAIELYKVGASDYFNDMWNVMDWANYIIYYVVFHQVLLVQSLATADSTAQRCDSYLCTQVGYYDDWQLLGEFRVCKQYLSLCVCIQLFKILKFASALIPKFDLATAVLRKCRNELVFFTISFIISMLSFSMMLFIQLGPVMEGYYNQIPAVISLFRALFGDFDVDEIMDNSSGYFNTLLFLGYLFVAIFIMLSMFLAILAEAQVKVGEDIEKMAKEGGAEYQASGGEYGVLMQSYTFSAKMATKAKAKLWPAAETAAEAVPAEDADQDEEEDGTPAAPAGDVRAIVPAIVPAGEGGAGEGEQIGSGSVDELLNAVDAIGGLLIELRSRMEVQESALSDVSQDVLQIGDVAQRGYEGVMTLRGDLSEQLTEVKDGLGLQAPMPAPRAPPGSRSRATTPSPRDVQARMQSARGRAAFRALRAGQSPAAPARSMNLGE